MSFGEIHDQRGLIPADVSRRALDANEVVLSDLVEQLRAIRRTMSALQAVEALALTTAFALAGLESEDLPRSSKDREMPLRSIAAEIGAALRMSDRTVQRRIDSAWTLTQCFPATHRALQQGRISAAHADAIIGARLPLDDEARTRFERHALALAEVESPGRLRGMLGAVADAMQATSATERHQTARAGRTVTVRDLDDGMAELLAVLPAVLARGIHDRLTQMAHTVHESRKTADPALGVDDDEPEAVDPRTLAQLRADILCDLALGGSTSAAGDGLDAIRAHVQIEIPVGALVGASDRGCTLLGSGPIDADTARRLAALAPGWDRLVTEPSTGSVMAIDRYRPSDEQRRMLRVRDEHCRFPGCRMAPWRSDLDHTVDAAFGGPTTVENLAHLCRRHHSLKHATAWRVRQLGGGRLEWTSPTGRAYTDEPPRILRSGPHFRADPAAHATDEPPPF